MPDETDKPEKTDEPEKPETPETTEEEGTVEDIAKRTAALDEGDELERIAREEEAKLAERKQKRTGKKAKGGLEAAASKRLAKIAEKTKPKRVVPDAVEAADPLIERTMRLRDWARKNRNTVQGLIVGAIVVAIGGGIYVYKQHQRAAEASVALAAAVADQRGEIGDPDKEEEGPHEKLPIFRTVEERRDAALSAYRDVENKYKGTGAAWLARLGEGALLLDKRDPDGAITAFDDVAGSSLAHADSEVRDRALEGMGFAYELRAELHPEERDKNLDQAIAEYKQIEQSDVFGFKQMALYHQGRCYEMKGDKPKAIEVLRNLREALMTNVDTRYFAELKEISDDRLRRLDPAAVPPKKKGIGATGKISPEILEQLPPDVRARLTGGGNE